MQETIPGSGSYHESHRNSESSSNNETFIDEDSCSDSNYTESEDYQSDDEQPHGSGYQRGRQNTRAGPSSSAETNQLPATSSSSSRATQRRLQQPLVTESAMLGGEIPSQSLYQPFQHHVSRWQMTPQTYWNDQRLIQQQQQQQHFTQQQPQFNRIQQFYPQTSLGHYNRLGTLWPEDVAGPMHENRHNVYNESPYDLGMPAREGEYYQFPGGLSTTRNSSQRSDTSDNRAYDLLSNEHEFRGPSFTPSANLTRDISSRWIAGSSSIGPTNEGPKENRGHQPRNPSLSSPLGPPAALTLAPLATQRSSASLSSLRQQEVLDQFPSLNRLIDIPLGGPGQSSTEANNRVSTAIWEEEGTVCLVVEFRGMAVTRRCDNNMINGTKLLNSAKITRGRRDGILKGERVRHVVKIGGMDFKGVWIPFERALEMAQREKVLDSLYPLFVANLTPILYSQQNYSRLRQLLARGSRKNPKFNEWIHGIPRPPQSSLSAHPTVPVVTTSSASNTHQSHQQHHSHQTPPPGPSSVTSFPYSLKEQQQQQQQQKQQQQQQHLRRATSSRRHGHRLSSSQYESMSALDESNINKGEERRRPNPYRNNWETQRHKRGASRSNIPFQGLPQHFTTQPDISQGEAVGHEKNAKAYEDSPSDSDESNH